MVPRVRSGHFFGPKGEERTLFMVPRVRCGHLFRPNGEERTLFRSQGRGAAFFGH